MKRFFTHINLHELVVRWITVTSDAVLSESSDMLISCKDGSDSEDDELDKSSSGGGISFARLQSLQVIGSSWTRTNSDRTAMKLAAAQVLLFIGSKINKPCAFLYLLKRFITLVTPATVEVSKVNFCKIVT